MLVERLAWYGFESASRRSSPPPWPAPRCPRGGAPGRRALRAPGRARGSCRTRALPAGSPVARGLGRTPFCWAIWARLDVCPAAGGIRVPHGRRRAGGALPRPLLPAGPAARARCRAVRRRAGVRHRRTARVAGKPSPGFYAAALASLGSSGEGPAAMVGDDLWSDIEGAQRAGLAGWLVRTGKFRDEALRQSGIRPDRILPQRRRPGRGVTVRLLRAIRRGLPFCLLAAPLPLLAPGEGLRRRRGAGRQRHRARRWCSSAGTSSIPTRPASSPGWRMPFTSRPGAVTIRRELLFRPGEPYDSARVAESERNLRALGIFRRVRSTRSVPIPGWSCGCSPRTGGAPRPTGGSAAPAAMSSSPSAWSKTTCWAPPAARRCAIARPPTAPA